MLKISVLTAELLPLLIALEQYVLIIQMDSWDAEFTNSLQMLLQHQQQSVRPVISIIISNLKPNVC